ncbi:MAG: SMC-Scp complex subunit ScpB [Candidatus Aenigmarchaeota archaeon]|nr:SMC-Scp complex subunit ScpB [Candidatus Aenigmarchaeota archaeon]
MMKKLALLEALLFTSNEPLSEEELAEDLGTKPEIIKEMLKQLAEKYENTESGIYLSDAGGYRLVVKPDFTQKVSHRTPHADLSRGLLRVLSIIVYHEPIKQSDIVKIVGNRTYEYVKDLTGRGLIKSEKHGRTKNLRTTSHFEEYFSVDKERLKALAKKRGNDERNDKPGAKAPD